MRSTSKWIGGLLGALLLLTVCQPKSTLQITLGGDIMLARDGQPLFKENPWSKFEPSGENLFFANLESPIAESAGLGKTEGYNLCADLRQVEILEAGGVDLVTTANNHQGDCGDGAKTAEVLEAGGIQSVDETASPHYIQTKVGVVGVIAADAVANPLDLDKVLQQVGNAKTHCEVLIVSLHWGFEYMVEPSLTQREWAQKLADAGVDVLWGHHPHVLQPMEWVNATEGKHQMLAMYSLGNLVADQWMTWETQHSALVTLRITNVGIDKVDIQPIRMDPVTRRLVQPSETSVKRINQRLTIPSRAIASK